MVTSLTVVSYHTSRSLKTTSVSMDSHDSSDFLQLSPLILIYNVLPPVPVKHVEGELLRWLSSFQAAWTQLASIQMTIILDPVNHASNSVVFWNLCSSHLARACGGPPGVSKAHNGASLSFPEGKWLTYGYYFRFESFGLLCQAVVQQRYQSSQ